MKDGIREMYEYKYRPENMRAFADFYWRLLIYTAAIFIAASIVFGVYELRAVLSNWGAIDAGAVTSAQPIPTFNKTQLQDTLDKFQIRIRRFESLKAASPEIADPSR